MATLALLLRRAHGLASLALLLWLVDATASVTPLGPLVAMTWSRAAGRTYLGASPLACYRPYFDTPAGAASALAGQLLAAAVEPRGAIEAAAHQAGVSVPHLQALLDLCQRAGAGCGTADSSPGQLAARLGAEKASFTGWPDRDDLALEAVLVGRTRVQQAIAVASAGRREVPGRYEHHRPFLRVDDATLQGLDRALTTALLHGLVTPAAGRPRLTSPFGRRTNPVTGAAQVHNGIDLALPLGTALRASQSGVVARRSQDDVSGQYVRLTHGHGVETVYCHLSAVVPSAGDAVGRAETLALSGNSGRSTGPHLHFMVRVAGQAIDPLPWLPDLAQPHALASR